MRRSVFDKEAWRDGSIAEKSRRSGADFLTKNQANLVAPTIKTEKAVFITAFSIINFKLRLEHTTIPTPKVGRMVGYINICAVNTVVALQNVANCTG